MTIIQKRANQEVLEILHHMHLTSKIPEKVLKNLQENQDENWYFKYDDQLPLEEQNMQKQTAILFSALYLMYICEDESEKEELKQIYKENEKKFASQNDFDKLMQNIKEEKQNASLVKSGKEKEENQLMEVSHGSLFDKIKQWLKAIFH